MIEGKIDAVRVSPKKTKNENGAYNVKNKRQ